MLHYESKLQLLVSQSLTEAEFVAMALTIKEVKWILQMLEELQVLVDALLLFVITKVPLRLFRIEVLQQDQNPSIISCKA